MDYKQEIEERDKLIHYLREQLVANTGAEVQLPYKWERFAGVPLGPPLSSTVETKKKTFQQAIGELDLPKPDPKQKGPKRSQKNTETFSSSSRLSKITLSGYQGRKVNPDTLGHFVTGVKNLTSLRIVELNGNGLTDLLTPQLEELILCKRLRRLNLSDNELGKTFAIKLAEHLRGGASHLEWLDVSKNPFASENNPIMSMATAIRRHDNLFHFAVSAQGNTTEHLIRAALANKKIKSLGLQHSKLTDGAVQALTAGLRATKSPPALSAVNLSHCFLDAHQVVLIGEMLKHTRSLVKLDLGFNGLGSKLARFVVEALRFNTSLVYLKLCYNNLDTAFCGVLAEQLQRNCILYECDVSGNPFSDEGAGMLLSCLGSFNTTLQSLGPLEQNRNLGITVREQLKSKTQAFEGEFTLLKPLEETNPDGILEVLPWNLSDAII